MNTDESADVEGIEDLRAIRYHHFGEDPTTPVTLAEFDLVARQLGYVKLDVDTEAGDYPEGLTLADWRGLLRLAAENVAREWIEKDGGWVKRPVCGECDGAGEVPVGEADESWRQSGRPTRLTTCPSCGGSGFGRLVALDGIDVEAIREAVRTRCDCQIGENDMVTLTLARQGLAAIDKQEDTDG